MDVLIISGGHIDVDFAEKYIKVNYFDRIIAADAGLSGCRALNLMPTDILGDFDSLKDKKLLDYYRKQGVSVRTFPAKKDYTDTHLAISLAVELSPDMITILGATGTRYDHALANISLLQWIADQRLNGRLVDEHNTMEMLCGPCSRDFRKDERLPFFSLIAWGGKADGIDLNGFSYPLKGGTLTTDISLGVSNTLIGESGRVSLKSGHLLVIRSCD